MLTVSLSDGDIGVDLLEFFGRLHSERRRTCEEGSDGAQIILGAHILVAQHVDDNRGNLKLISN